MSWWGRTNPDRYPGLAAALEVGRWEPAGPLVGVPWVVFDTETTGFHPYAGDEIISLAARRLSTGEEYSSLVQPGRPIPQAVSDLTGIRGEDLLEAPGALTVLEQFLSFTGRSVLVAHCVDFDRAFVEAKLRKVGRLRWTHPVLDTMQLARALFPAWGEYRLEHCATMLQTAVEGRHTALGDARTTSRILEALLAECGYRGLLTWQQLTWFLHARQVW